MVREEKNLLRVPRDVVSLKRWMKIEMFPWEFMLCTLRWNIRRQFYKNSISICCRTHSNKCNGSPLRANTWIDVFFFALIVIEYICIGISFSCFQVRFPLHQKILRWHFWIQHRWKYRGKLLSISTQYPLINTMLRTNQQMPGKNIYIYSLPKYVWTKCMNQCIIWVYAPKNVVLKCGLIEFGMHLKC